ncbi:MAG: PA14 domain-containing protein, partial [Saprospiraceae bacterium]
MRRSVLFLLLVAGLLVLWFFAGRHSSNGDVMAARDAGRPNSPWVFRSVLDKKPRMVTFALNDHLWVAYSVDSCSLYKAWSGSVAFEGAVYNMRHGPQPTSVGSGWFENKYRQPWSVTLNGQTQSPRPDYKGHRYTDDGHAEILYDLVLDNGQRIRINERPEYVERNHQSGFERRYTMENAPAGAVVTLHTNVGSIADPVNIETDGQWKLTDSKPAAAGPNLSAIAVEGDLQLRLNKATRFATLFVNMPLYANANATAFSEEESPNLSPGEKIMAKNDCRTCHNAQVKTVGPAYVNIAERYKNIPENLEKLAQKVMKGGSGVWGIAAMSAHPDLQIEDAKAMVSYVLALDEGTDDGEGSEGAASKELSSIPESNWLKPDATVSDREMVPGLVAKVFQLTAAPTTLGKIDFNAKPTFTGIVNTMEVGGGNFGPFQDNFSFFATGFLFLEKDDNVVLQLSSDDGSRLYLDGKLLIDNDGPHGMEPKEAEVALRSGYHALRIEYFQGGGGRGISLKWARFNQSEFKPIPEANYTHRTADNPVGAGVLGTSTTVLPGDGAPLIEVHPAYDLSQARPDEFLPKVSGMDFLPDGRLLVTVWDATGAVYALENVSSGDPKKIKVKKIAEGLAEPLGIKVVDGDIYVLQKQELTKLVDHNKDGIIDEYQCFAKGWRASANFHEFAFGLVYKDGFFYATLATAIMPGGASARPQITDRGKVLKISKQDGSLEFIARGLRTPDGV